MQGLSPKEKVMKLKLSKMLRDRAKERHERDEIRMLRKQPNGKKIKKRALNVTTPYLEMVFSTLSTRSHES